MRTAEHLTRAIVRALLANPTLEPEISINSEGTRGQLFSVEIDTRPFDPAPIIGSGGTMKFAIQTALAGTYTPAIWDINFRTVGTLKSPKLRGAKPDPAVFEPVMAALVNHWRADGRLAQSKLESSETAVVCILTLDSSLANAQRAALSRLIRGIGLANGFRATVIVEKAEAMA